MSTALALLSDQRLRDRLSAATALGSGIGGRTQLLDVNGVPVFVKRIPLTDLERRPDNVGSTANLFRLPAYYQYGVGSAGFGAWRELAAQIMTTNWVLTNRCANFPLLYHWRVLTEPSAPPAADVSADIERTVAFWHGSSAIRDRVTAVATATASITLFLEHIPHTMDGWLTAQAAGAGSTLANAAVLAERQLRDVTSFMESNGLLHFDAHFGNLLTDGTRLYVADFGLATSPRFELSAAEERFLEARSGHDVDYVLTRLVNWLVNRVCGADDRDGIIERCARGVAVDAPAAPAAVAELIRRHAPVAAAMNRFYRILHSVRRTEPYPAEDLRRARLVSSAQ
ncbi:hypothetical protein ABZ863_26455 [Saccharomonospora sp. NPDC046836]|uniref:hypothetical protein n=1 Tax=Saccharomonospora sp. NPDC046836 TaxID=3156921 RepID=UPI0033E9DBC9